MKHVGVPRLAAALAGTALLLVSGAVAAAYPERPIHMYIGSNPAGSTDMLGRVLAKSLEAELGQPVVVHNRTGAGGSVIITGLDASRNDQAVRKLGQAGGSARVDGAAVDVRDRAAVKKLVE